MAELTVRELYEAHRHLEEKMPKLLEAFGERVWDAPWSIYYLSMERPSEADIAFGKELMALHPEWAEPYKPGE